MAAKRPPQPPKDLKGRGRRFWRAAFKEFDFRPDERIVLEEVCRHMEIIDRIRAEIGDGPMTVPGSRGQDVAHPLLQELRSSRELEAKLLRQLGFEDDDVSSSAARSASARTLANARWRMGSP